MIRIKPTLCYSVGISAHHGKRSSSQIHQFILAIFTMINKIKRAYFLFMVLLMAREQYILQICQIFTKIDAEIKNRIQSGLQVVTTNGSSRTLIPQMGVCWDASCSMQGERHTHNAEQVNIQSESSSNKLVNVQMTTMNVIQGSIKIKTVMRI